MVRIRIGRILARNIRVGCEIYIRHNMITFVTFGIICHICDYHHKERCMSTMRYFRYIFCIQVD